MWIHHHNKDIKYSDNGLKYVLDDQIYFFHDSVRDKAFIPVLHETGKQNEVSHKKYWKKKVGSNPISLNVKFYHPQGIVLSGHIDVKENAIDNK